MEVIIHEIAAFIHLPSNNFEYELLASKIQNCNDTAIAEQLRYLGLNTANYSKISRLMELFMDKDMWLSCKYIIVNNNYDFNKICSTNEDLRKYYLVLCLLIENRGYPPLFHIFLVNDPYFCGEVLELFVRKYSTMHIRASCRLLKNMPFHCNLINHVHSYLDGVDFIHSKRYAWITGCILR